MQPTDSELGLITLYLKQLSEGDAAAESLLAEAVYAQLQRIARRVVHGGPDVSLEATALVNEVLLELVRTRSIQWRDREHFFELRGGCCEGDLSITSARNGPPSGRRRGRAWSSRTCCFPPRTASRKSS